jgi:selenocysteine lyase/cysteine desulfurase
VKKFDAGQRKECFIAPTPSAAWNLENWLWKTHKIRIRGGDPNELRLSTPYYLQKKDIDRFLEKFDEYKRVKNA